MTLEDYIRQNYAQGKVDFTFRVSVDDQVSLYLRPTILNQAAPFSITTPNVVVEGNTLIWPDGWALQ